MDDTDDKVWELFAQRELMRIDGGRHLTGEPQALPIERIIENHYGISIEYPTLFRIHRNRFQIQEIVLSRAAQAAEFHSIILDIPENVARFVVSHRFDSSADVQLNNLFTHSSVVEISAVRRNTAESTVLSRICWVCTSLSKRLSWKESLNFINF